MFGGPDGGLGLEFDDVLLYNFCGSSPASAAQWRAVGRQVDTNKYRVLESELKRLYVAVTRARLHIWIWDSSKTADPMLVRRVSIWTDFLRLTGMIEELLAVYKPG